METRILYTDKRFPQIQLRECELGLEILRRTSKSGRPTIISCEHYASTALGFFEGLANA